MAASAREEKQKQQAYEGLGAGGKFRKTPFRRTTQATPYERPSTSLRNPSDAANDGWLSKLVDPAQRLISSSAHRLFSSVFRKRLPPPLPPQSPSTGVNHEPKIKDKQEVAMGPAGLQKGRIDQRAGPSTTVDGDKFNELEQILEQKTFTRSEIDRLTALLHSRTVDITIENREKRSEVIPSMPVVSHNREEFPKTPVQEKNGIESRLTSNSVVSTSVLDEDVASPAELAKAYMGSRPSKVSPSMLGFRGQAQHEDSPNLISVPFPSKSPLMSLVPRASVNGGAPENGFVTPRSRGRSAIYSMARTPYSRVRTTSTFKGAGSTVDAHGGASSSSSQSVWEQSESSASKQGSLKRRFSVLDNDIGSFGPIRRIRQKPNLLSSRGLSSPVSSTTSSRRTRINSEAAQAPSSSMWKPLSLGEPKHKALTENPSTSFSVTPSLSNATAVKIWEQIDKIASPKEKSSDPKLHIVRDKSPTMLSPSMLRGQALKSMEHVDSSKFLENVHNNNSDSKLKVSFDHLIPHARDFNSQKQDKVKENGPLRIGAPYDSSSKLMNGADSTTEKKDIVPNVKTAVSAASNSVQFPQKGKAFKMSAHEDYVELDDDENSIGVASDGRGKVEILTKKGSVSTATVTPPAFSEVKSAASPSASSSSNSIIPALVAGKVDHPKEAQAGSPMFKFGGEVTKVKDSNAASPVVSFSSKSDEKVAQPQNNFASSPAVGESVDVNFGAILQPKPESSNSASMVVAGATNSVPKSLESDKDDKNYSNVEVSFGIPEITHSSAVSSAPSSTGTFSFGGTPSNNSAPSSTVSFGSTPSNNPNLNNGSSPLFSSSAPSVFNNLTSPNFSGTTTLSANTNSVNIATTTAVTINSSNYSSLAPEPSFPAAPVFKFASSTPSIAVTSVPVSFEGKNKEDKGFGTLSSVSFSGTPAANASTGNNTFGFVAGAAATTSIANNQAQASVFGGSGSVSISQASSAGTGNASFSQSVPTEPGSSASSVSFGLAGTAAVSSGSSLFGSTSTAKLFSSGASTALGSSNSSLEVNSISSNTAPSIFGSSWAPSKSPVFSSTFNSTSSSTRFSYGASSAAPATAPVVFGGPSTAATTTSSTPFVFGGSSTSSATTNSAPTGFGASAASTSTNSASMLFGSSNGASSTTMFSFTPSATSSAPSQPAFGNPNPTFPFVSSGNNDQMNMEDSMAEDTNQASTPMVSVFGQQPVFAQQPVSTPQPAFGFASTPTAPMANPFQFNQQNLANPQNPFQDSGSLGQGSSFSLGSGGDKANRRIVKVSRHNRQRKK